MPRSAAATTATATATATTTGTATAASQLSGKQEQLLSELEKAGAELSGQDLHAQLRTSQQPMGLATVYRNLRQLQQLGLVRCRHLPSGEALYAPAERDEHHLTCVDCGSTETLDVCPVHGVQLSAQQLAGFRPLFHTLEFFGLCSTCQQRQGLATDITSSTTAARTTASNTTASNTTASSTTAVPPASCCEPAAAITTETNHAESVAG